MSPLPYVYSWISVLFEQKEARDAVRGVVLFGSAATGALDAESDIDVFVDARADAVKRVQASVVAADKRFSAVSERVWDPVGARWPIAPLVGDLTEARWDELRSELSSTGIVLYGKFEAGAPGAGHWVLYTFQLRKLTQTDAMRFRRRLFGHVIQSRGKRYARPGLLERIGGARVGTKAVLVPVEKARELRKLFTEFKVTPQVRELWVKE